MMDWIKELFWDELKEEVMFFIKNFKKIIKKTWKESKSEMKSFLKS